MKKLLCFFLPALVAGFAHGQLYPKAGLSAATFSSESERSGDLKEQLKAGFLVGIGYNIQLGNFSLAPELLFVQKGSTSKYTEIEPPFISIYETEKITLNYLELPVLFKYAFGPEALKIYGQFGPSFSVGLGGKGSYEGSVDLGNGPVTSSYEYSVKNLKIDLTAMTAMTGTSKIEPMWVSRLVAV